MHGFEHDASFGFLQGLTLTQVCLGQYATQLHFGPQGSISMEGQYVHLTSEDREIVQPRSSCGPNELFRLLGQSVVEVAIISTERMLISFSNGDALTLIDDSEQYESFVVNWDQRIIVI
jgi:hypothetical protein